MVEDYLSVKEAADYLKRTPGSIYNLIFLKRIPYYKPNGGRVLFKKEELQAWVERSAIATEETIAAQAARR